MNAPATHLDEIQGLLPALESPTVTPLAHAGMIAIHSVVGSDDVWGLLPRLKAAGASGILVLPIEKIIHVRMSYPEPRPIPPPSSRRGGGASSAAMTGAGALARSASAGPTRAPTQPIAR